ncbi:MAG: hypothetical protein HY014_05295 [Acidobacteria bacterium]|nr:hypothetical protein [Acidobacteriota bacterium]MBI3487567.1 hypothetical protein [Acidobacteriota bacterium]
MSKQRVSRFGQGLLAVALATGMLEAQELGFSKDLKIRTAWAPEAKDNLRQSSLGFGLNFAYTTSAGTYAAELGYYYKTGDTFIEPVAGTPPLGLDPVDLPNSGDSRRNQLDGLALRLSFARKMNADWSWQAGVMLGGTRFKHEYFGDVRGQDWIESNPTSWRDTYSGTPVEGGIKASPYAGLSWKLNGHSSLEVNLMLLNYTALSYQHKPGTGQYALDTDPESDPSVGRIAPHNAFPSDGLVKSNRLVPHLEFGYVFHF